jgi:hypothetical protein
MNCDFEKRLQELPMREIPGHWKAQIAAAANPPVSHWWREWLWPCPRAWAGLAAAWGIIFLLYVTAPDEPGVAGKTASGSWQSFAMLQKETEIIAQLSGSEESRPAPPSQPAATQPRSSRRVKQSVG